MKPTLGPLSLLPPFAALLLALTTHDVILSLAIGVYSGFLIVAGYDPFAALAAFFERGLAAQLADPAHGALILLILIIGGFVGLLERSGGMEAFARRIAAWVKGPVGAQIAVWLAGMGIFFSDSATPLILGPIFQPVLQRVGVSREKLAYIIDSTASPVCVLVPFISWGVYVMSLIDQSYRHLGIEGDSFDAFLRLLPYQFYPLLALVCVPLVVLSRRELGPMVAAQAAAAAAQEAEVEAPRQEALPAVSPRVIVLPLAALLLSVAALFVAFRLTRGGLTGRTLNTALILAYLAATLTALLLLRREGLMDLKQGLSTFRRGVEKMLLIPLILLLAWSLGHTCQLLGTGKYIAALARRFLAPSVLPSALFLVGAVISFAMGSAWGTFAILMPIAISVSHSLGASLTPAMAAVLSGGLFGDHASPISDTTILASMGAGCRHIDHVRTQLPYALLPASVAVVAFFASTVWESPLVLLLAAAALVLLLLGTMSRFGKPTIPA